MAPKYGVGKRVKGIRGLTLGFRGIISNRVQVSGSWWLDITWENGQVTRSRTGDIELEGAEAPNNEPVPPNPVALRNGIGEPDEDGSEEENSQRSESSDDSDREAIGGPDG